MLLMAQKIVNQFDVNFQLCRRYCCFYCFVDKIGPNVTLCICAICERHNNYSLLLLLFFLRILFLAHHLYLGRRTNCEDLF